MTMLKHCQYFVQPLSPAISRRNESFNMNCPSASLLTRKYLHTCACAAQVWPRLLFEGGVFHSELLIVQHYSRAAYIRRNTAYLIMPSVYLWSCISTVILNSFYLPSLSLSFPLIPFLLPLLCSPLLLFSQGHGPQKTGKHSSNKKGKKKASRTRNKSSEKGTLLIGDDLSQKLYQTMEKHRKVRKKRNGEKGGS